MMVLGFLSVHHFNGLVKMRIKRFTLCRNWSQPEFGERVLQLLVDEFDSAAKFRLVGSAGLQGALEAVQGGQQSLQGIGDGLLAEFLLLAGGSLACIL